MEFIFPTTIGGISALSGFIAGYYYSFKSIDIKDIINSYSEFIIINTENIKHKPNKKLNKQLTEFNKLNLKKSNVTKKNINSDEEMLNKLREKIKIRRINIECE